MSPSAEPKARCRSNLFALIALTLVGLAVFSPVLNGPFLSWDDREHLELNPLVTTQNFSEIWTRPYFGLYIPVTYSIWAVIYKVTQSPAAFHIFNVLLHVLNAWLVFLLIGRTNREKWAPWAGAGFFLLHPLQVEAVAWVSGARDLLAGFFGLLTLYWISRKTSLLTYILGLLSKPTLLTLPAAIYPFQPSKAYKLAPMLALGMALAVFTAYIQIPDYITSGADVHFWQTPLIALDALGFYFQKLFAPALSADYGRNPHLMIEQKLYLNSGVFLMIGAAMFWSARKNSQIKKYGLFALFMLLPVLGLIPFQAQAQSTVADRYVYVAMFGIAAIVGELNKKYWLAFGAALAACAFLSFKRATVWSSNEKFFTQMFIDNPKSYPANVSLGMIALFKHEDSRAEMHLREAMKLRPNNAEAAVNLASLLWVSGRPQLILQDLEPLLRDPLYMERNASATRAISMLHRLVARAEASQGLGEKARLDYCRFLSMDPENPDGRIEVQEFLSKWKSSCSP